MAASVPPPCPAGVPPCPGLPSPQALGFRTCLPTWLPSPSSRLHGLHVGAGCSRRETPIEPLPACPPWMCQGPQPVATLSQSHAPPHCPWPLELVRSASPVCLLLRLARPGKWQCQALSTHSCPPPPWPHPSIICPIPTRLLASFLQTLTFQSPQGGWIMVQRYPGLLRDTHTHTHIHTRDVYTQRKDHGKTQQESGHLQAKERCLRKKAKLSKP